MVGTVKLTAALPKLNNLPQFDSKWSFLVRPYLRSINQYRMFVALFVKQSGGEKEDQPEAIRHFLVEDLTYKKIKKAKLS